jgi:tetratricopeptide (TPR) repeat protein
MYDEALQQFSRALKLNPANAAILYNHRARVYHYQNQIELAGDELEKGWRWSRGIRCCGLRRGTSRCGWAT